MISPAALKDALNWRYATKVFDPEKIIPVDLWEALLKALVLTPSSFGLQPWKFIVVENKSLRKNLRDASWGQAQVTDADKLVVFTARTDMTPEDSRRWIERLAIVQGQQPEDLAAVHGIIDGFIANMDVKQRHAWNVRQVYIALGQFMTSAALLGVDACPLEGIDPAAYDSILDLEGSGYATCVACAAGYRDPSDRSAGRPKARFEASEMIDVV